MPLRLGPLQQRRDARLVLRPMKTIWHAWTSCAVRDRLDDDLPALDLLAARDLQQIVLDSGAALMPMVKGVALEAAGHSTYLVKLNR